MNQGPTYDGYGHSPYHGSHYDGTGNTGPRYTIKKKNTIKAQHSQEQPHVHKGYGQYGNGIEKT